MILVGDTVKVEKIKGKFVVIDRKELRRKTVLKLEEVKSKRKRPLRLERYEEDVELVEKRSFDVDMIKDIKM